MLKILCFNDVLSEDALNFDGATFLKKRCLKRCLILHIMFVFHRKKAGNTGNYIFAKVSQGTQ